MLTNTPRNSSYTNPFLAPRSSKYCMWTQDFFPVGKPSSHTLPRYPTSMWRGPKQIGRCRKSLFVVLLLDFVFFFSVYWTNVLRIICGNLSLYKKTRSTKTLISYGWERKHFKWTTQYRFHLNKDLHSSKIWKESKSSPVHAVGTL